MTANTPETGATGTGPGPGPAPGPAAGADVWAATFAKQNAETDQRVDDALNGPHGHVASEWHSGRFRLDVLGVDFVDASGSGGGYVKLAEVGPLIGTQATIRLPASSTLPADVYDTYILRAHLIAASGVGVGVQLQFNGDTAANYSFTRTRVDTGGAFSPDGGAGGTYLDCGAVDAVANYFTDVNGTIQQPQGSTYKTVDLNIVWPSNGSDAAQLRRVGGSWQQTAAITSLLLTLATAANFGIGSWAAVYGVKGD